MARGFNSDKVVSSTFSKKTDGSSEIQGNSSFYPVEGHQGQAIASKGNANLLNMFSVPLYKFSIPNWEEEKKEIIASLPEEKLVKTRDEDIHTDFFDYYGKGLLPPYSDLILDILLPYMGMVCEHQWCGINGMWYQTEHKYQKHMLHNHGTVGWSSVLYINYDSEVHTATRFLSPYNKIAGSGGLLNWFQPKVKEGDYIIFPSDLAHEAMPNESDKKRTIISVNFSSTPAFPIKQFEVPKLPDK
jgi:hypothetical protein|tara:strand:+ start:1930 stop:2661 length:732 start_codon:yes stop_codon:yes gene_type:complete